MHANYINKNDKLIYPELSYVLTGICFEIHNDLGRYCKEIQYCNKIEEKLAALKIPYKRELLVAKTGNKIDFLVNDEVVLEIKAKKFILKDDYYQTQRYLQVLDKKLALIINFRNRYLKPIRVIKIDTDTKSKFL